MDRIKHISIIIHAIKRKPGHIELSLLLGIVAVYIMLFLRLGISERSHLFEYGILAIIIHQAFIDGKKKGVNFHHPRLKVWILAFMIGVLDEVIQVFIPERVFDPQDIIFNGFAVSLVLGLNVIINRVRQRINKS